MRIAIDYRVLSSDAANRGMGRYTQQQLRGVLKRDLDNEYLVICYPYLFHSLLDPDIKSAKNVRFVHFNEDEINNNRLSLPLEKTLEYSSKFQDFLYRQKVDLYHATTPFIDPIIPDFDVCPLVSTLYDLIPLIFPKEYLDDLKVSQKYRMALYSIRSSRRLISISEATRQDAYYYLGCPPESNSVAYPIVDPSFRVLSEMERMSLSKDLKANLNLHSQFILSITGRHHSKNAKTLLDAFKRLPDSLQREMPLLLVFPLPFVEKDFISSYGVQENVIYTNSISEDELVALYNSATMVIHPSRYEGFGYPVAEAMKCGAPVITTTVSSLPEIGGDTAILVDPESTEGFVHAIEELYSDPEKRERMRQQGPVRAAMFSEEQLAHFTLEAYQDVLGQRDHGKTNDKKRVAIWSSLPPLNCGVADYTAELLSPLQTYYDVEVFVDGNYLPAEHLLYAHTIHHNSAFERRDRQARFDAVIYQMGATFFQNFMYDVIVKKPGIVVFHDFIMALGFYFIHNSLNTLSDFEKKFLLVEGKDVLKSYGKIIRNAKTNLTQDLDELFREHYILKWIMDNSLGQIVHMNHAKADLEQRYENSNVHVVNMGVRDMWDERRVRHPRALRMGLGIQPDTLVVGIFGSVVRVKRIEACLHALRELVNVYPNVLMVIVGSQLQPDYYAELEKTVSDLGLQSFVKFTGRTSVADFDNYFLACDLIINLRYPTYKGMSAILIRALAAGKPVIVSNVPEWREFPQEFCWRVSPDETEADQVAHFLTRAMEDPQFLRDASELARQYFRQRGTLAHMAEQYHQVVEQVISQ